MKFTHKLAVTAYLYHHGKFLFLYRNTDPKVWAPPGGHLQVNEPPDTGVSREIKEETGLDVKYLFPVSTWFGEWRGNKILSIDYLAEPYDREVALSEEHSDYRWVSAEQLKQGHPIELAPVLDLKVSDFEYAEQVFHMLQNNQHIFTNS